MVKRCISAMMVATIFFTGCTHSLQVKNISLYEPEFINSLATQKVLGVYSTEVEPHEERLLSEVANRMKRDGFKIIYPYHKTEENKNTVDYIVKVSIESAFKGSGWNFLINWPGFLIWTPAWHGYNYRAQFDVVFDIVNAKTSQELPQVKLPIDLNIRHADINRTWTEISWLEWSVIAFIGGIVFIQYDESVTPILLETHEDELSEYIYSKIAAPIVADSECSIMREEKKQPIETHESVLDTELPETTNAVGAETVVPVAVVSSPMDVKSSMGKTS